MKKMPVSTVSINRCGLFLGNIENSNAWGTVECDTKLNPFHQDLIEATIEINKGQIARDGGELWFKASYYELDKLLTLNKHYYLIDEGFKDMQKALISMTKIIKHENKEFTLLDRTAIITHFRKLKENHITNISDQKSIAGIKFSKMFSSLYLDNIDLKLYYNGGLLTKILKMKNHHAKSLVRFLLTHSSNQNISKDKILEILGAESPMQKHRIWKYLSSSNEFEQFGISINENSICYVKNKDVIISNKLLD